MEVGEVLSSLVVGSGIACGPDLMRIMDTAHAPVVDRRKRIRLPLSWTLYLGHANATHLVRGRTKNVSSNGFYCYVPEAFNVGEYVRCTMLVPTFNADLTPMSLHCRVTVLRVDVEAPNLYGIACRIDDYSVANGPQSVR
jgi:PilZ domain